MEKTRIEIKNEIDLLPFEEDIYVHHELKEDSEFMTDRVSIICGDIPIDNESKDGVIDVISSKKYWYNHKAYWLKYLRNHYVTDDYLRQWREKNSKDYFIPIVQCLSTYKDIILLDITDLDEEEKHQIALLLIPESMTEKQYKTLEENTDYLSSYQNIFVQGGTSVGDPEIFFDSSFELPINENIPGSTFPDFLKDTLQKYLKNQSLQK